MRQRFFFDGINMNGVGIGVSQRVKRAAFVFADKAKAGLAVADVAITRAQVTNHLVIGGAGIKLSFHHDRTSYFLFILSLIKKYTKIKEKSSKFSQKRGRNEQ
jgi:hypothetical protein